MKINFWRQRSVEEQVARDWQRMQQPTWAAFAWLLAVVVPTPGPRQFRDKK